MNLYKGQIVGVPCDIQPGAFSNEYLVSIHTSDEDTLSGFADAADVHPSPNDHSKGFVRATVIDTVGTDTVKLRIHASFFTIAAGTTVFPWTWADNNLREVSA